MVIYRSGYQERLDRAAAELATCIVRNMDPDRIILFGSVVSGAVGPDSDVDVLWSAPEEVRRLQSSSSSVRHAFATGRLLYERP